MPGCVARVSGIVSEKDVNDSVSLNTFSRKISRNQTSFLAAIHNFTRSRSRREISGNRHTLIASTPETDGIGQEHQPILSVLAFANLIVLPLN